MKLTVLLLDNNVYGLTKNQTSPTARTGQKSNTHPQGSALPPLNPIAVTLGITNASFVAQTIDWNPPHLYNTIQAAYEHPGTAFVRVLQRCPHFTSFVFEDALHDSNQVLLMNHERGIPLEPTQLARFPQQVAHDPGNLAEARALEERTDVYPIGLFYRNAGASRYDEISARGLGKSAAQKLQAIEQTIERFAI
jgi:2-oxoglutarate ferredoxin oxidoreductase subunit beta